MIDHFAGRHGFLSNFYHCPTGVRLDGVTYPSVEHAYQAAKTLDTSLRQGFLNPGVTSATAKKMGRRLPLRPRWEELKVAIMRDLLHEKFSDVTLATLLLETGEEELVEGNWWGDTFWGVCNGKGYNWLGKLLMDVRANLRAERIV